MNSNGIKYETGHFFIEVEGIPAGELFADYENEIYSAISYRTELAPLVNYYDLDAKDSESIAECLDNRAVPQSRVNCEAILKNWGLTVWDAFDQFYVTHGRAAGDPQTVKFVGTDISQDEVFTIRSKYVKNIKN